MKIVYIYIINVFIHFTIEFKYSEKERNDYEVLYTHTTFFLAQHYGNYGDEKQASYYCGLTLYRQLNYNSYIPHEWIKNCLSFSEVFFGRGYINITLPLIKKCEEVYEKSNFSDDSDHQLEAKGNIDITYGAIYCTSLKNCWILETTGEAVERKEISPNLMEILDLIVSVNVVSNIPNNIPPLPSSSNTTETDNNNDNNNEIPLPPPPPSPQQQQQQSSEDNNHTVPDTTDTIINNNNNNNDIYLNTPPSNINLPEGNANINYEEALVLFKSANHYYNKAKLYFRLDGWVTDYINILKDQSKLYHYLSVYVTEESKRITMNQKRIDLLEPIIGELNTQAFSNIITELHYELGEIYSDSLDEKVRKITKKQEDAEAKGTTYKLKKIEIQKLRLFSSKCMLHFEEFTKYYFKDGKRPDTLDDQEGIQPYMHASFNIARMLTKMADTFENDLKEKLEYDKKSYLYYKYVAEFGNNNINLLNDESKSILRMAEEFTNLLPSKLDQISAQIRAQQH